MTLSKFKVVKAMVHDNSHFYNQKSHKSRSQHQTQKNRKRDHPIWMDKGKSQWDISRQYSHFNESDNTLDIDLRGLNLILSGVYSYSVTLNGEIYSGSWLIRLTDVSLAAK